MDRLQRKLILLDYLESNIEMREDKQKDLEDLANDPTVHPNLRKHVKILMIENLAETFSLKKQQTKAKSDISSLRETGSSPSVN